MNTKATIPLRITKWGVYTFQNALINNFKVKIDKIKFSGAVNLESLTPFDVQDTDLDIPNVIWEDDVKGYVDFDGILTFKYDFSSATKTFYPFWINGVGLFGTIDGSNYKMVAYAPLMATYIKPGIEVCYLFKLFLSDNNWVNTIDFNLLSLTQLNYWKIATFKDEKKDILVPKDEIIQAYKFNLVEAGAPEKFVNYGYIKIENLSVNTIEIQNLTIETKEGESFPYILNTKLGGNDYIQTIIRMPYKKMTLNAKGITGTGILNIEHSGTIVVPS